jgi:argininosuccinate lyase
VSDAAQKTMWSGRFEQPPDASFWNFQRSFPFDQCLLRHELAVDRAWARALQAAGVLTAEELRQMLAALDAIGQRAEREPVWMASSTAEDVHHFIELHVRESLGALGAKLHTGRSRNELVATEFRMWVRDAAHEMRRGVAKLGRALLSQAEQHLGVPMPGNTHLQHAQPILFSHYLHAQVEAFLRDAERIAAASAAADACPMGSGALAGSTLALDRAAIARELGFTRITANSLDATSCRDFALDYLYALALVAVHLSRLAEDIVLFATPEFGFIVLPDEYSTGSSLMPQKKNPDAWELLRGKSGRVIGHLMSLLVTLKGLPTGYQRDLQEDKEPVFAAHDQARAMLETAAGAIAAMRINVVRMREAADDPGLLATEAADYLVGRGVPFREAHEIVGKAVREAERRGQPWTTLPLEKLQTFSPAFGADLYSVLTVDAALARRRAPGGTAPETVRAALAGCRERLQQLEENL